MERGTSTYIERMEIVSFGRLKNIQIKPSAGLNLLYAPNESGKSTLAAFIKFVFYGFSGQRKQTVSENEKTLYMPWDGTRADGTVVLVTPKGKFRIHRIQSQSKETLDVCDAYTLKPVFAGMVPGEVFFGLGEESFGKVLFFRQLYTAENGDNALAEQIQNLIFSADEKTNTERAIKRLKETRAQLRNNQKKGVIPELEAEYATYAGKLEEAMEIKRELDEVTVLLGDKKSKVGYNNEKIAALDKELENIRRYEAKQRLAAITETARRKKDADRKYENCMAGFDSNEIPDIEFARSLVEDNARFIAAQKETDKLALDIEAEKARLDELVKSSPFFETPPEKAKKAVSSKRRLTVVLSVFAAAFAGVAAWRYLTEGMGTVTYAAAGLCAALAIAAVINAAVFPSALKRLGFGSASAFRTALGEFPLLGRQAAEKRAKLQLMEKAYSEAAESHATLKSSIATRIRKYVSGEEKQYDVAVQRILNLSLEAGQLKAEADSLDRQLAAELADVDIQELRTLAEGAMLPKRKAADAERDIKLMRGMNDGLMKQVNELEVKKGKLESGNVSPAVLAGKREAVTAKLAEARMSYDALGIALDTLTEAGDYMKATVSPQLAELASGYLQPATDGKYGGMTLATDLTMTVPTEYGEKSADFLSAGAYDIAYLCLRCALIDLLYKREKPFLVLDDAFARIDSARLANILTLLSELAAKDEQQIFVFTCHKREGDMLDRLAPGYGTLQL